MRLTVVDRDARETKRYPSIGRCIYCGDSQGILTDEHIIPYGLVGNGIVFEKASCPVCAKVTSSIERTVLRTCLGTFRARTEAPTRRPKKRVTTVEVKALRISAQTKETIGEVATFKLPIGDFPRTFTALKLPPPGLMLGQPPSRDVISSSVPLFDPEEMHTFFEKHLPPAAPGEGVALEIGKVNKSAFIRMIAKIAHAYAVAEEGADAFVPLLPDIILGRADTYAYLVGGDEETPRDPTAISTLRLATFQGDKEYL